MSLIQHVVRGLLKGTIFVTIFFALYVSMNSMYKPQNTKYDPHAGTTNQQNLQEIHRNNVRTRKTLINFPRVKPFNGMFSAFSGLGIFSWWVL
mgnify:CR=1 FL=1